MTTTELLSPPADGRCARRRRGEVVAVVLLTLLALAHALAVGTRYHVGSFDDDASYILTAKTIAAGGGFATPIGPGLPLISTYPPGFAAFLTPFALFGASLNLYRLFPLACYLALFPLTWLFLRKRGVHPVACGCTLLLLAANPVLGTYATMVMAETLFLVVLLGMLTLVERWEHHERALNWVAVGAVVLGGLLVWVKEAGIGMVAGMILLLALRRHWSKAAVAAVGSAVLLAPVALSRLVLGTPVAGSRYSRDLGGHSGLWHRFTQMPHSLRVYVWTVLPKSLVPTTGSPFPHHGGTAMALDYIRWSIAPLVIIGVVVWVRRHGAAVPVIIGTYILEILGYPYLNERRVVLILPLVVVWYVLGAAAVGRAAAAVLPWLRRRAVPVVATTIGLTAVSLPLAFQFPKDYLLPLWQSTSAPAGSPYMSLLGHLGAPSDVVETDFVWATALTTGHRTATSAYSVTCPPLGTSSPTVPPAPTPVAAALQQALTADAASYLLIAGLEARNYLSNPCLVRFAATDPGAVRLLRTPADDAAVYEFVGPGSAQPELQNDTAGARLLTSSPAVSWRMEAPQVRAEVAATYPVIDSSGGRGVLGWSWSSPRPVTQVSLGAAEVQNGPTGGVSVQLRTADGRWKTVAGARGEVGGTAAVPWLLARLPTPVMATAVRVVITGQGQVGMHDLVAIGPAG